MFDIQAYWAAVLRQDADAMRPFFAQDAVVRWHCSNEEFSLEEFIRANCEYPGDWEGEVERAEHSGDTLICVLRVWPRDKSASFHVTSFLRLAGDRITALDEYWADDGEAPDWRKRLGIGRKIRE